MVYKLRFNRNTHLLFDISADEIEAKLGVIFLLDHLENWSEIWTPLDGRFYDDSDKKNMLSVPDITLWFTDEIVCNDKAYRVLKEPLGSYGEWLPVNVEGIAYWLLHVTKKTEMENINLKASERTIDAIDNIEVQKLSFIQKKIEDLLIFKTAYNNYQNIYCTENFRNLIEKNKLQGLVFSSDMSNSPF